MKKSVSLLADFVSSSHQRNGVRVQPNLRARMKYGARLQRAAKFEEKEIGNSFRLTSVRRSLAGLRCLE